MSVGTGRENIIILFWKITVSFLGINKWEPDIYMGFSPVLHLQCSRLCISILASRAGWLECRWCRPPAVADLTPESPSATAQAASTSANSRAHGWRAELPNISPRWSRLVNSNSSKRLVVVLLLHHSLLQQHSLFQLVPFHRTK
jgi:hypothetical protein